MASRFLANCSKNLLSDSGFAVLFALLILWFSPCASGDQIVLESANHVRARFIKIEEGRIHFRSGDGRIYQEWLSDVRLLLIDRTGMFDDFNQAERQMEAGEPEKAVLRYERAMRLADDAWAELIAGRLLWAYDKLGQFDKAAASFVRVARGKWTGPALAARLIPQTVPVRKDAKLARGIEVLDSALSDDTPEALRILFEALRFEWLSNVGDPRAGRIIKALSTLPVPEGVRTVRLYNILEESYRLWLEKEPGPDSLRALDRGILECPPENLPDLLMFKGAALAQLAQTRSDASRATWPFLRVAIHMPQHPRVPESLYSAAVLLFRMGASQPAESLLKEALSHPALSGDIKVQVESLPQRLKDLPPLRTDAGDALGASDRTPPAEETRLGAGVFREGLKARGLTELLELHIHDYPTTNPTAVLLMAREVKLAQFADASRPASERQAALAAANALLRQLIDDFPSDSRRMEWRYTLAGSLLFDEAEPPATRILLGFGSMRDRTTLGEIASRALEVTRSLSRDIAAEYERIDGLSVEQFEDVERTGYLDTLDRYAPGVDYLGLWALFYDALSREEGSVEAAHRFNDVLVALSAKPALVNTPHAQSRVQIPALLLTGMTHRRLGDHAKARAYLERVLSEADRITDAALRADVQWAVTLACVENIANDRDNLLFEESLAKLSRFKEQDFVKTADGFALRLAAVMLERSILLTRAAESEKLGRLEQATADRSLATEAFLNQIASEPQAREQVFAALYAVLGKSSDSAAGHGPLEQCAWMWGRLTDADEMPVEQAKGVVAQVIATGEDLLKTTSPSAIPEILFQLGVAYHKNQDALAAAKAFLRLSRDFPKSQLAMRSAVLAVQLLGELSQGDKTIDPAVQELFGQALRTLIENFPQSPHAAYWRFAYARWLEDERQHQQAAQIYETIDSQHPNYLEALFLRLKILAANAGSTDDLSGVQAAYARLEVEIERRLLEADAAQRESLNRILAEARLIAAESSQTAAESRRALEMLKDFEFRFPSETSLRPRMWRTRFAALESLGRIDEAAHTIAAFVQLDPAQAGPSLQALYARLAAEADTIKAAGSDEQAAARKLEIARRIAEELVTWAEMHPTLVNADARRALRIQHAEAQLRAGRVQDALNLFERLLTDASQHGAEIEPRVLMGHAEALMAKGDCAQALPEFNKLATRLPPADGIRWRALLSDLQCRTLLDQPPEGILRVIEQQRYLYPEMGGPDLASRFEALARQNLSRKARP